MTTDPMTKARLRDIMEEVDALDLPDGAYWALIAERAGMEYGEPQDWLVADPGFYGWEVKGDVG